MSVTEEKPAYLTYDQAAIRANVSKRTLQRAIKNGELRVGRHHRIKPAWVDKWMDGRTR